MLVKSKLRITPLKMEKHQFNRTSMLSPEITNLDENSSSSSSDGTTIFAKNED